MVISNVQIICVLASTAAADKAAVRGLCTESTWKRLQTWFLTGSACSQVSTAAGTRCGRSCSLWVLSWCRSSWMTSLSGSRSAHESP
jgi:hypothetical protein